jgi:CubicO group peptidase (beta-lactamase class C family)
MRSSFTKKGFHFLGYLCCALLLSSCWALRAYKYRKLKLNDHERLPFAKVERDSSITQALPTAMGSNFNSRLQQVLDSNLRNTYTAAFVVVRNDSIIYENYFDGSHAQTLLPSFSVAKSIVSTLVGIALSEGALHSTNDPITNYIPELLDTDPRYAKISLQNLLHMRSGLQFNEGSYGLKDDAIKLGFSTNYQKRAFKTKIEKKPGGAFNYQSINTFLLGVAVERATKTPLATYAAKKLWQPLGAETNATWNTDKHGQAIGYAGFNATARDYAKFGLLALHQGQWNKQQIVPAEWLRSSTSIDSLVKYDGYSNQWWGTTTYTSCKDSLACVAQQNSTIGAGSVKAYKTKEGNTIYYFPYYERLFFAEGILGQFVVVIPEKNIVIVRLGHYWQHPKYDDVKEFLKILVKEL